VTGKKSHCEPTPFNVALGERRRKACSRGETSSCPKELTAKRMLRGEEDKLRIITSCGTREAPRHRWQVKRRNMEGRGNIQRGRPRKGSEVGGLACRKRLAYATAERIKKTRSSGKTEGKEP